MNSIPLQFERLRRHSEAAASTYDHVSFVDLSHSLRIWADLKKTITSSADEFARRSIFQTALPSRQALQVLREREFVYSLIADGVVTYASNGELVGLRDQARQPPDAEVIAKMRHDGRKLEVAFYAYISPHLDLKVEEIFGRQRLARRTFQQWMDSRVVVGAYPTSEGKLESFSLTREQLIRRVANELDASHPRGLLVPDSAADASRATHYLLNHVVAGLPLPYFHLLKDAQDIVSAGQMFFSGEAT